MKLILMVVCALLTLSGCATPGEPGEGRNMLRSEQAADVCAQTSGYHMAETERGYYFQTAEVLYYADKTNLTNWITVCNEPNCDGERETCPAYFSGGFRLYGDRIESIRDPLNFNPKEEPCDALYSMAADGTDLRQEYKLEGSNMDRGGTGNTYLLAEQILACYSTLQTDGTYLNSVLQINATDVSVLYEGRSKDADSFLFLNACDLTAMRGDCAVYVGFLAGAEPLKHLYRPAAGGLEEIENICDYDLLGAYLAEDRLLHFVPNDGYYETELSTKTSRKVDGPQFSDSWAFHLTEDCIFETNLLAQNELETPEARFYDGTAWRSIALPAELMAEGEVTLSPVALTSEGLFLATYPECKTDLYYVPLGTEPLSMTLCGEFEGA